MVRSHSRKNFARPGIAAVELALCLPVLMFLLIGTWEVGRLIEVTNIVSNAAREGARAAASAQRTEAQCQQAAINYMRNNGLNVTGAVVTVTTTSGLDPSLVEQLERVAVTVELPFAQNTWVNLNFFVDSNRKVTAKADWRSMADFPLAVDADLPVEE